MAIKRYSAFPKAPVFVGAHDQIFSVIYRTYVGEVLSLGRDAVSVFYSPNRLSQGESSFIDISYAANRTKWRLT